MGMYVSIVIRQSKEGGRQCSSHIARKTTKTNLCVVLLPCRVFFSFHSLLEKMDRRKQNLGHLLVFSCRPGDYCKLEL